jgi:hypothetical protein
MTSVLAKWHFQSIADVAAGMSVGLLISLLLGFLFVRGLKTGRTMPGAWIFCRNESPFFYWLQQGILAFLSATLFLATVVGAADSLFR